MFKEFKKKVLNKKNIFILVYVVLIFVFLYLIFLNFSKQKSFEDVSRANKEILKLDSLKKIDKKDTDGDGLEDWQEHLYGTDIELIDTDNDGISDFDEVNNDSDPLVYGGGESKDIEKIININLGVVGIVEQRKNLDLYKKKLAQEEKRRFELYLKKNSDSLTSSQREEFKKNLLNNRKIKGDFNLMGRIISDYEVGIDLSKTNDFEIFFSVITGNSSEEITTEQLNYFKKVANINKVTAQKLKEIKVEHSEIIKFRDDLVKGYKNIGENLLILLDKYNNKDFDNKNNLNIYSESVSKIILTRQYIYLFIESNGIKFEGYEKGSIFSYSL